MASRGPTKTATLTVLDGAERKAEQQRVQRVVEPLERLEPQPDGAELERAGRDGVHVERHHKHDEQRHLHGRRQRNR